MAVAVLCLSVGYLLFDDSAEVRDLRLRVQELEAMGNAGHGPGQPPGTSNAPRTPRFAFSAARPGGPGTEDPGIEVTAADLAQEEKLNREFLEHGEYHMNMEGPVARKHLAKDLDAHVESGRPLVAAEYGDVFSRLGVDSGSSQKLQKHLVKIMRSEAEANTFVSVSKQARLDYDRRVRSVLSEEQYGRYRQYEDSKIALRTTEEVKKFASSDGIAINPETLNQVQGLIKETGAHSFVSQFTGSSPYHPAPIVGVGKAEGIAGYGEFVSNLGQNSGVLLEQATAAGLPEETLQLLQKYYSKETTALNTKIERMKNLPEPHDAWPTNRASIDSRVRRILDTTKPTASP